MFYQDKIKQANYNFLKSILIRLSVFLFFLSFFLITPVKVHASNLFSDGFESGDLTKWTTAVTDGGDLSVGSTAALHGSYGLSVYINDTGAKYVQDNTPTNTSIYRFRFYINPNGLVMANNDLFTLMKVTGNPSASQNLWINFLYTTVAGYKIQVYAKKDDTTSLVTSNYVLSNTLHYIEINWKAATSAGANDGFMSLYIDDPNTPVETLSNIDNDTLNIQKFYFGAVAGLDAGTSGTFYLDDFASNNDGSEIGVYVAPPSVPSSLAQYKADGTTTITSGTFTNESTATLKFSMSSDNNPDSLTPQVEIRVIGVGFTNTVTNSGDAVAYSGAPVVGVVTVTGLTSEKTYHWQARVSNSSGQSSWVAMGGSPDFGVDTTAPTGGSIIYTDGYYTSLSVGLTANDGTDSGSGINTLSRIIQRKSATLSNGSCGTYGGFETITPTGTYPNFTDTTVSSGNCYQYQYLVSDNLAHQATYSALDLGMGLFSTSDTLLFDGYVDDLIANEFTELRIDIPTYMDTAWLARSKAAVIRAIAKGANVIWGVSCNNGGGQTDYTITAENWPDFRQAILDAAAWAQVNGVYEFQLGNEEEFHQHRHPVSITRTNNIATVTFTEDHGFTVGNPVTIRGAGTFNAYPTPTTITVTGAKTFTYANTGSDGSASNPGGIEVYNLPDTTLEANIKAVATDVQAIFTRGNLSYSTGNNTFLGQWHTLGRGDIDILAFNVYTNYPYDWHEDVDNMINWWGADHTYITEFSLNYHSLDEYSTDEAVQGAGIASMIGYIKDAGVTRANYFFYGPSDAFGARKSDGTYRQLWNILKSNINIVKVDTSTPTGGSMTYTDGYYNSLSVGLTANDGTDSVSGINTSSRIIQRKSATLSDGSCGDYGSFETITPTGTYQDFTDSTVVSGNCYQYQYLVSDNATNQAIYTPSNTVKVDTSTPTAPGTPSTTSPTNSSSQTWTWTAATDTVSGIASYAWRVVDQLNNAIVNGTTTGLSVVTNLAEGVWSFFVKAIDNATNQGNESTSSVTVDQTAPTISSVSSSLTSSGAIITWTTSKDASSRVDYGLTSSYGSSTDETDTPAGVQSHSVSLSGLVFCTSYHYRVRSTDAATNEKVGDDNTFISYGCPFSLSSSSSQTATNTAPSCGDARPASTPDLFQININSNTAKLFFTPISNTNQFYVSFSTQPLAEEYGAEATLAREGVQNFTINLLKPNTIYYFKVRGQNGCMPGDWSNIMKVVTRPQGVTKTVFYYKNLFVKINSLLTPVKKLMKVSSSPVTTTPSAVSIISPQPTPSLAPNIITKPTTSPIVTPTPKKFCFLWWCF